MRILVPVDDKPYSDMAVAQAGLLAATLAVSGTEDAVSVTLFTVLRHPETATDHTLLLEKRAAQLGTAVADVSLQAVEQHSGHPAEAIVAAAADHDLIVMGKRPSSDWRARLLGPTTRNVVEHAPCPVLIAKNTLSPINHILLCDSGLQQPSLLKRFLQHMKPLLTAETDITVLHVMSQISAAPGVHGEQLRADAETLMKSDAWEGEFLRQDDAQLAEMGIPRRIKVRHGLVLDEILAEAQSDAYDLLVVGVHRSEGILDLLLENMTRPLIEKVKRPILVIP